MVESPSVGDVGGDGFRRSAVSIVGIGVSAGGLEACFALFKHIPANTDLAFVVIPHLDPKHGSLLPELLLRFTTMPVRAVEEEMAVEPNCVFVMPANNEIIFAEGMLRLLPREEAPKTFYMPIDGVFLSLAENLGHRAIGVILPSAGTDGALGLEAIRAEGGFTFASDTRSAKSAGMPSSAFATGYADFVLPPEGIAQELIRIARDPYRKGPPIDGTSQAANDDGSDIRKPLKRILRFLHGATGLDFTQYRSSTIRRRVMRRMAINDFSDEEGYRRFLASTPGEVELLCEEMIPRVTRFFRDERAFEALKKEVFPYFLVDRAAGAAIRIWVPGCASGEEVYALAICLVEFLRDNCADFPIQIFGTDLSVIAIQKARKGLYDFNIAEDVSPERLEQFFVKRPSGYQISGVVRETCIFANHDLVRDPPFSKLDLVSCRNVLIYLDGIQDRIIPMFHRSLNSRGFLLLGAAESARRFPDLFELLDKKSQIYSRLPAERKEVRSWNPVATAEQSKPARKALNTWNPAELQARADQAVAARYGPSGVVVNENWQILQVRGNVSAYLEAAPGKMSVNVIRMAGRSGLAVDLSAALEQAKAERIPVRKENVSSLKSKGSVNLEVIPLNPQENKAGPYLILFEEIARMETKKSDHREDGASVPKSELLSLQKELNATRNRLMTMLENQQVLADETQSMNEENLSNLEEMRSFNEELETAKEELQSTNEELTMVNDELESRNNDLQRARDFATSIVDAVWEAQLVLDKNWSVKMANEAFYQTFQLTERETKERVFFELADRALDVPALRSKLEAAFSENSGFTDLEIEVRFPQAGRKVLCVNGRRLKDDEMILLALDDITARRDAEKELDRVQEAARQGQKMEAIGRLAGGIAHDFNNLMTVVLGFSQMLIESLEKGTQAHHRATEINKAGDRAAALTRQLLAFSRRQVLQPQPLDLNSVILEMEKMLRRLIGDNIALEKTLARDLWVVCADPGQMGQVILNLALNARDAMPNGGVLTIRTANTTIKKRGKRLRNLKPGSYVSLSIQDSGEGIDQEAQQHIFEPFYTTKEQGSGTGLGLATVSGIVQQSGGSIEFESEVARGTTFWVDLPRVEAAVAIEKPVKADEVPAGTETVLVVEDEQALRAMAVEILEQLGYTVLQASQADEGLEVCRSYLSDIDLLLTDVLMPGGMSGRQLAELAALIRPGIKVLIVSGYTTDSLVHYGIEKGAPFLHKPFTVEQLACKVREVLDAGVKLDGPETNARVKRAGRSVS